MHWECGVLATGPPGKSPASGIFVFLRGLEGCEEEARGGKLSTICAAMSIRCLYIKRRGCQSRYFQKLIHLIDGRASSVWGKRGGWRFFLELLSCLPHPVPPRCPFTWPGLPWNKPFHLSAPARERDTGMRMARESQRPKGSSQSSPPPSPPDPQGRRTGNEVA